MNTRTAYLPRLFETLRIIEGMMERLIEASPMSISRWNNADSPVVVIAPSVYWGVLDDDGRRLQIEVRKNYEDWFEHVSLLIPKLPNDIQNQVGEANTFIRRWIERESDWGLSELPAENKRYFTEQAKILHSSLSLLSHGAPCKAIVVPDTNAMIFCPDPSMYSEITGDSRFSFALTPTLLSELDKLKVHHRDRDFRDKVKAAVNRIKGWRNQGSLLGGVTVQRTVTVRAIATEPNFERGLKWLDPENEDDRLIASAMEIQLEHPDSCVIVVSSDINLQNKAELANLCYAEPPADE